MRDKKGQRRDFGLIIDTEHGYFVVSPDCGVICKNELVGIVECKTSIKFSARSVCDCLKEYAYPLTSVKINQNGTTKLVIPLKQTNAWYHQIHCKNAHRI